MLGAHKQRQWNCIYNLDINELFQKLNNIYNEGASDAFAPAQYNSDIKKQKTKTKEFIN